MLLAVVSCHSREEFSNVISNTWLPQAPPELDVRFFRGRGATRAPQPNEVFLDCGDAYLDLPEKVQAIVKWAYDNGYDYVAKCDDDVVVKPRAWYHGFLRTNFSGWQDPGCKPGEIRTPWGFFYVLNRDCMLRIINAPLPGRAGALHSYEHGNDEAWVSTVLHYQDIFLSSDARYYLYLGARPTPGQGHGQWQDLGPKRSLRAPPRPVAQPQGRLPSLDWFAACIYLTWNKEQNTPEKIISEFHKVFREGI